MASREKVIEGIEAIRDFFGFGVPSQSPTFEAYQRILTDAINLLKEQEAVPPKREYVGIGITWWYVCGNCQTALNPDAKFCHECGKKVKWE